MRLAPLTHMSTTQKQAATMYFSHYKKKRKKYLHTSYSIVGALNVRRHNMRSEIPIGTDSVSLFVSLHGAVMTVNVHMRLSGITEELLAQAMAKCAARVAQQFPASNDMMSTSSCNDCLRSPPGLRVSWHIESRQTCDGRQNQ